jgi:hypothetical protein
MAYEFPGIEVPNGAVARSKGRIISFHAALAELTAVFGMANQRFDTSAAIDKAGVGLLEAPDHALHLPVKPPRQRRFRPLVIEGSSVGHKNHRMLPIV